ncbi:MAG: UMP kinase [SAR202 cluster bacterium]|jgi:uridylate kinase|nr:UMP kinase [SAR202 cluster bacterium]
MSQNGARYRRVLLKLSGESFKGTRGFGIDHDAVSYMARQIKSIRQMGVELGVVVGGGNIWRGAEAESLGMDRASADYAGMLATVINALTLQDSLERNYDVDTRTQSAINVQQVAEPYIRRRAIRHLEKGRVVLFASGLGSPFMTTDTAAALRVTEIDAEILLMAKHGVDGVYESDPNTNPNASRLDFITYRDAITKRLGVMDTTALSLCEENNIPIVVFDLFVEGSIERIISGERVGSLVAETDPIPAG